MGVHGHTLEFKLVFDVHLDGRRCGLGRLELRADGGAERGAYQVKGSGHGDVIQPLGAALRKGQGRHPGGDDMVGMIAGPGRIVGDDELSAHPIDDFAHLIHQPGLVGQSQALVVIPELALTKLRA